MKFFSELGSCWGGAMISPEAETAGGGRKTEELGRNCRTHGETSKRTGKVKVKPHGGAVRHWKPELNAISEDSPISEAYRSGVRRLDGSDAKKPPLKVKPRSRPPPSAGAPSYEEDYWKSSHTLALPAFSPTSFLF